MLMPVIEDVRGQGRPHAAATSASPARAPPTTCPGQAFSFVSTLDGVGPWPPIQESHVEMDGAWALYEAWVKLQLGESTPPSSTATASRRPGPIHEVLTRQLDPYHVGPAVARRHQPGRPAGPGAARRRQGHRGGLRRGRRPQPQRRARQPERPARRGTGSVEEHLDEPYVGRPAAQARLPADHRRRRARWCSPPTTRPASCCERPGVDPRHRPPHRADGPRPARPHRLGLDPAGGREGRVPTRHVRRGRAARPVQPTRS